MKVTETKSRAIQLLAEIAGRAEAAKSKEGIAEALQPLLKHGACAKAYLVTFNGESVSILTPGEAETRVPMLGSSFEAIRIGIPYVDNGIGRYSGYFDERRLAEEGFTAYVCAPFGGIKPEGALCLAKKGGAKFDAEETATASIASSHLGSALARIELAGKAESSQQLSSVLLEKSASFLLVSNAVTGDILETNTGAEVISGYSQAELKRLNLAQLFHGDILKGKQEPGLFSLVRKNGDKRVLDLRIGTVTRNGGNLLVLSGSDTTEKHTVERDYKDVLESISDILFTLDGDGQITSINDEVMRSLGRKKDSLVGAPLGGIVYEPDYRVLADALRSERDIRGVELRLLTGSNEQRWFELSGRCYRNANTGNVVKVAGVLRDVHERKRSSEQASLVANVMEKSSDAIVLIDTSGMIRFWNKGAESLLGYLKSEMEGRTAYEFCPDSKRRELDSAISRLNASGGALEYDTERLRKGGASIQVHVSASAQKDEEGKVEYYMEMIKDLTAQKQVEESMKRQGELEARNKSLRELDKEKSVFVSSVSHELRTPLTNIHGYSALLMDEEAGALGEEQKKYASIIHSETDRLTKLINELLDQSRIDRGKFKISPVLFDLRDLVDKCSCPMSAEKKKLYVNWEFGDDVPPAYGDPARISQVLLNFVSNAVKFTDTGGVTVKVSRKSRNFIQVDVVDTGPGISEEDQKKLFKPFSQITPQDGQKRGGSGLGLSISKGIIKLHGGQIGVSSKPGSGSRFWFTIRTQPNKRGVAKKDSQGVVQ